MRVFPRGQLPRSLLFSLGVTVALGVIPFAAAQRASFLGKDVSSIASSIVGFYPGSAVAEILRVVGLAWAFWSIVLAVGFGAARRRTGSRARWAFAALPFVSYACWWWGAALKYPALFQGFLPEVGQKLLFRAAFVVSPEVLFGIAAVSFLVPLVVLLPKKRRVVEVVTASAAAMGITLVAGDAGRSLAGDKKVNLLLIGVDSLRTDRLARADVAPHLRALIEDPQTVSFQDHYVGIPRTFPSWIEMLTGRYAAKTGIRHMFPSFGDRQDTFQGLITSLDEQGYRTEAVSDFAGDIFPRFSAGYDQVHAPKLTLMTMIRLSVDQSFPAFLPMLVTGPFRQFFPALKQSPAFGDPRHLGDLAEERVAVRAGEPWAVTVFFSTAHFPYAAPHPYYSMFAAKDYDGPFRFEKNPEAGGDQGPTAADIQQAKALYDGAVRAVDDELGRLFADLKAAGQWDQTLIVITADHGEDLYEDGLLQGHGEHLRGENVLKVPLIMKMPMGVTPKERRPAFVSRSIDLASTVLGSMGWSRRVGEGVDLTPFLVRDTAAPKLQAFAETEIWFSRGGPGFFQAKRLDYPGIAGLLSFDQGYSGEIVLNPLYEKMIVTAKHRMLIDGDWKIIYMPTSSGIEYELYDRRRDPANLNNLAEDQPEKLTEMKRKLLAFLEREEAPRGRLVDGFVVPP